MINHAVAEYFARGSVVRLSFVNLIAADDVVVTASSERVAYPATNVQSPERPFLPWKTGALGNQWVVIDFLSAKTLEVFELVRANFVSVRIQGNATDSWATPSYDNVVEITRNPFTGRYQYGAVLRNFAYRFLRLSIPSQATTDGATGYLLGGIWAGAKVVPPEGVGADVHYEVIEPRKDVSPEHGGWRQRLILGDPIMRLRLNRLVHARKLTPGLSDDFASWLDIDRFARDADRFAIILGADTSQVYVVRSLGPLTWDMNRLRRASGSWALEEVLGA